MTEAAGAGGQTKNLVGSTISLITNAEIRYEGTLVKLDQAERSMHLTKVKSFGTEGRQKEGKPEVPPRDNIIESVIFKIDMIKDFNIAKRPEEPKKQEPESDPAIVEAPEKPKPQEPRREKKDRGPRGALRGHDNENLKQKYQEEFDYTGRTLDKKPEKPAETKPEAEEQKEAPKEAEKAKEESEEEDPSAGFFDTITNSTVVKEEPRQPRGGYNRGRGGYPRGGGGQPRQ